MPLFFFAAAALSLPGLANASFDPVVLARVSESLETILALPWYYVDQAVKAFASGNLDGPGGVGAPSRSLGVDDNSSRAFLFPIAASMPQSVAWVYTGHPNGKFVGYAQQSKAGSPAFIYMAGTVKASLQRLHVAKQYPAHPLVPACVQTKT